MYYEGKTNDVVLTHMHPYTCVECLAKFP